MNQQLPLAVAAEWMTRGAAAALLGVHVRTVARMVEDGRLPGYWPEAAEGEESPLLLYKPEVQEFKHARNLVAGKRGK